MGFLFSKSKKEPTQQKPPAAAKKAELSDTDRAQLELKRARDRLRRQQEAAERCIEKEKELATELVKSKQKQKAIMVLKRKAMKEKVLQRVRGQMENVEIMIDKITEADNNVKVFETLRQGNEELKNLQSQMDLDDIQQIMDDTAESIEIQNQISEALGQNLNTSEQAEIDSEVAAMMELFDQGIDPFATNTAEVAQTVEEEDYSNVEMPNAPTNKVPNKVTKRAEVEEEEEGELALA